MPKPGLEKRPAETSQIPLRYDKKLKDIPERK